ncbi:MAG: alpha-hydroxy acid oxidase [Gammaproteobacteria bacterium]
MAVPINLFEYEALAKTNLSEMAWAYFAGGAGDEVTLAENRTAFSRYTLHPRVLVDLSERQLATDIIGHRLSMPILIAPTAFQCLAHEEGELATARAAARMGVVMVLSTLATKSLEEVADAYRRARKTSADHDPPGLWFQLYVHRDRGLTRSLVERAEAAGYRALCVTVDTPVLGRRERDHRNRFFLPPGLDLANLAESAHRNLPPGRSESSLLEYFAEQVDPTITWRDLDWLQSITRLPLVVKGILRADDAQLAVEHGAQAVILSNHGGRQLDTAVATIDVLAEVAGALGGRTQILLDGGIRRGTDVFKALALGARSVLLGRPVLWGLAVSGQKGVEHALTLLRDELDTTMALAGCPNLESIDPSLVRAR